MLGFQRGSCFPGHVGLEVFQNGTLMGLGCREGSPRLRTDLLGILQVIEPFILLHVIKVVSIKTAQV